MKITISQDAKEFLNSGGYGALYVEIKEYGGCGGSHYDSSVLPGKPENADAFDIFSIDGVDVYVYKDAETLDDSISIYLEVECMMFKTLHASGLKYPLSSFDLFGVQ